MAFNNTEDFLTSGTYKYNLEFECSDEKYKELPTIDRFIIYKASGLTTGYRYSSTDDFINKVHSEWAEICTNQADCDGSGNKGNNLLIRDIYKKLWGWSNDNNDTIFSFLKKDYFKCKFGGDTMNSVSNLLNDLFNDILNKEENEPLRKEGKKASIGYIINLYNNENTKELLLSELHKTDYLLEYMDTYHTIGNFVLVPAGFNKNRGGQDYWDYALNTLKNFGYGKLDAQDFELYINYYFLWDYVDIDGTPKQLKANGKTEFMKKAILFIKRRSIFMISMLRLEAMLGKKYDEIRDTVFNEASRIYRGYDEVIKLIKNKLTTNKVEVNNILDECKVLINEIKE